MKVRRGFLMLAALVMLAGCAQSNRTPGTILKFSSVAVGDSPGDSTAASASAVIARTRAEVSALLASTLPWMDQYPTEADAVIVVFGGTQANGGYGVTVREVRRQGSVLQVTARLVPPPDDLATTQALANPYTVVAVPRADLTEVANTTVQLQR